MAKKKSITKTKVTKTVMGRGTFFECGSIAAAVEFNGDIYLKGQRFTAEEAVEASAVLRHAAKQSEHNLQHLRDGLMLHGGGGL
jgi:hypothetical protein